MLKEADLGCSPSLSNQAHELSPSLGSISEDSQHATGDSLSSGLLNSSHSHAHMFAFYDDCYPLRPQSFVQSQGYLFGQTFLDR